MKSREQKRIEGDARNADWRTLTPAEQLADLDRRLEPGQGATHQREKLARVLA